MTFCNLNKQICSNTAVFFYQKFKRYLKLLFLRQNNLFFDFIKVSVLFIHKKISVANFLILLSLIFKSLHKKKHNLYLYFLKDLFSEFLNSKSVSFRQDKIKGIKFLLCGKNSGKLRSSKIKLVLGLIPTKTIDNHIEYSKCNVYTIYGSFGLKLWIHYR
jgi:hypothetical protein